MRRMIMGILGLLLVQAGRGQTFAEWFKQNSTRLKYYAQQIAALKVYAGELAREYQVSSAGLTTISGGQRGEYDLHQDYYASLENINPALERMGEIGEIAVLQTATIQQFSAALTRYRKDGLLGAGEVVYLGQVYSAVLQAGLADVETLVEVLTADTWQMTDDQRMARVREVDQAMRDRYAFTMAFTAHADLLERQLAAEAADIKTVKGLYGGP